MRPEVRNWWEALADQYEEWAENPPMRGDGDEDHTCAALASPLWGFRWWSPHACGCLKPIWCDRFGDTDYPAGLVIGRNRPALRFEFCHYMAETIREYLEGCE